MSSPGPICTQCDKPAVVKYADSPLCVQHNLMMFQADYLQSAMLASMANTIADQIDAGTGYLTRASRVILPRPPFVGDTFTLNNINVSNSTVGVINSGTIQNLDNRIDLTRAEGETDLASALQEFAQELHNSQDLAEEQANEIAEQLDFLLTQVGAKPEARTIGLAKSALSGIKATLAASPVLIGLWDKLAPHIIRMLQV